MKTTWQKRRRMRRPSRSDSCPLRAWDAEPEMKYMVAYQERLLVDAKELDMEARRVASMVSSVCLRFSIKFEELLR